MTLNPTYLLRFIYLYYTCLQIVISGAINITGGDAGIIAMEWDINTADDHTSQCELSIIIPIYNGERFLRDTLDSVLKQSYKNFELILVDDGSTDGTPELCEEYAKKDARVKVRHQKNAGMSKARDAGVQMALPYTSIAFLDGDDIFAPDMFEDMMKYKEYDIVQVCSKHVNTDRILEYGFDTNAARIEFMTGKRLLYRYFYPNKNEGDIGYLWGMLINRKFYEKVEALFRDAEKILPQNYLNDVYCVPRFLMNTKRAVLLNKVYILHRISKYTDSRLIKPNALHYELALANKMNLDYYKKCNVQPMYDKQVIGFYLVILKIWYQTITSETDLQKQKRYARLVQKYYKDYYAELKKVKCNSPKEYIVMWSIKLFGIDKTLWRVTVGKLRYGLMYRLQV